MTVLVNIQIEMYSGYITCCLVVSHAEYVPHALLRLEKDGTDRRTEERTPDHYIALANR